MEFSFPGAIASPPLFVQVTEINEKTWKEKENHCQFTVYLINMRLAA